MGIFVLQKFRLYRYMVPPKDFQWLANISLRGVFKIFLILLFTKVEAKILGVPFDLLQIVSLMTYSRMIFYLQRLMSNPFL